MDFAQKEVILYHCTLVSFCLILNLCLYYRNEYIFLHHHIAPLMMLSKKLETFYSLKPFLVHTICFIYRILNSI